MDKKLKRMNPVLKNIVAVIAGIFIGGVVNMAIITMSGYIASLPEVVDPNDLQSIRVHMSSY